jgi:hypothetical protein
VDDSVDANFFPICPDFPIPETTTFPVQAKRSSQALKNCSSKCSVKFRTACASTSKTRRASDKISVDDFYDQKHARIYEALRALYEKRSAIDVLTLSDQLKGNGFLDMVGGPSYLTELTNFVPTAAHVEQYADIVAQKALRRRLISASADMADLGQDESKDLKELIEEAESRLFAVSQQHVKQSVVSLESVLAESFERLDDLHKDKKQTAWRTYWLSRPRKHPCRLTAFRPVYHSSAPVHGKNRFCTKPRAQSRDPGQGSRTRF